MLEFFFFNFCSLEVAMKRNSCLYLHHWMSTAMQVMVERYVNQIFLSKIKTMLIIVKLTINLKIIT